MGFYSKLGWQVEGGEFDVPEVGPHYVMRYSARHRWHYFPHMEPSHALILKTYDSETDGRARFMGHSAFEDPTSPLNAPRRESIEVRTMAFF